MTTVHFATLFDTPPKARMSAEDYIASPQSAHKSDLIEGVFVMASPASFVHSELQAFLLTTMRNFVNQHNRGVVLGENSAYRLNEDNVYQPDVSFLAHERMSLAGEVYVEGAPDLAVEVLSPSSRRYDLVEKRVNYARFGVREYWVVDPIERTATVYELLQQEWVPVRAEDGVLRSRVLDGFWLQLAWLFPEPAQARPSELDIARLQGLI
jgi:Uma2 family endonuclease